MDYEWTLRNLEYSVIPELKRNIRDQTETIEILKDRIAQLEEKERERAREAHAKEEHLDFLDSEGLGKQ